MHFLALLVEQYASINNNNSNNNNNKSNTNTAATITNSSNEIRLNNNNNNDNDNENNDDNEMLLTFTEKWIAIYASSELSLKNLTVDMTQLNEQFEKLNTEFNRIKTTTSNNNNDDKKIKKKENFGLDGVLEDEFGFFLFLFFIFLI
jgi:predicted nuclease with TOPRIM domain